MATGTAGPSSASNVPENEVKKEEYKLTKESELRLEVEGQEKVIMYLKSGLAEMFGTELMKGRAYTFFGGSKVAVYTWHGCTLEIEGNPESAYVAKETPMTFYINLHGLLEQMRNDAAQIGDKGPVVLIAGPSDVGKSTLCKILLNYAVRRQKTPLFIDIDVGQSSICVPGTMALNTIELPADPETGFSVIAPLVYHYGSLSPDGNASLYKMLTEKCSESMKAKFEADKKVKHAGAIINTCGWVTQGGYHMLVHAVKSFQPDVVLVIDSERLYNSLVKDSPSCVRTVLVPKSGGVVTRSKGVRSSSRDAKVREYFYGSPITCGPDGRAIKGSSINKTIFYPLSFDVKFEAMKIFRIGEPDILGSLLPIGMKPDPTKLTQITSIHSLKMHQLLSISAIEFEKESQTSTSLKSSLKTQVASAPVQGIICITNIDTDRGFLTVLSPQPKPLPPNAIYLTSDVLFIDSHQ